MNRQDLFNMAKLQLTRLNEDWSLKPGDIMSHDAARFLRVDYSDSDPYVSVEHLLIGQGKIVKEYMIYCDPDSGPINTISQYESRERWHQLYDSASTTLDMLEDTFGQSYAKRFEALRLKIYSCNI